MGQFSRTWWGERFIAALERFTDAGRLSRGRSYASNGRVLEHSIANGKVTAKVRGSINPYFGVYKEPIYDTSITIKAITSSEWTKVMQRITGRADLVTKLLMNEMPDTIEDVFAELDLHLLPYSQSEFVTKCSCPDYANPCKHIAGVYYLLAAALDQDPFVMFELRGLSRDALRAQLERSPLGQVLASALVTKEPVVEPVGSFFTRPVRGDGVEVGAGSYKEFWTGARRLPALPVAGREAGVRAILVKKQGDFPAFWGKDGSFIGVMEEWYERVRGKSRQMK